MPSMTVGTCLCGVGLIYELDLDPGVFGLVGKILAHPAVRPVGDLLVVDVIDGNLIGDIAHVADG